MTGPLGVGLVCELEHSTVLYSTRILNDDGPICHMARIQLTINERLWIVCGNVKEMDTSGLKDLKRK